jgi:hypothetical protein
VSAMADPATVALVVGGLLIGGTKPGRASARNAVSSGYRAAGWRTPGKASVHHCGRAGALAGRSVAGTVRTGKRLGPVLGLDHGVAGRLRSQITAPRRCRPAS